MVIAGCAGAEDMIDSKMAICDDVVCRRWERYSSQCRCPQFRRRVRLQAAMLCERDYAKEGLNHTALWKASALTE